MAAQHLEYSYNPEKEKLEYIMPLIATLNSLLEKKSDGDHFEAIVNVTSQLSVRLTDTLKKGKKEEELITLESFSLILRTLLIPVLHGGVVVNLLKVTEILHEMLIMDRVKLFDDHR